MSKKQKKKLIKKLIEMCIKIFKQILKETLCIIGILSIYVPIFTYGIINNSIY